MLEKRWLYIVVPKQYKVPQLHVRRALIVGENERFYRVEIEGGDWFAADRSKAPIYKPEAHSTASGALSAYIKENMAAIRRAKREILLFNLERELAKSLLKELSKVRPC